MGNDKKMTRLIGGLLGFLSAFGGVGCMVTGLRFEGVSMLAVALCCAAGAALFAVTLRLRFFPLVPAALTLILLGLWWSGPLNIAAEALVAQISYLYDLGYGWGIVRWSGRVLSSGMAQPAFCALGAVISLAVCRSFIRGSGIWTAIVVSFAPVVPCMILTDTAPDTPYLFIQLVCIVLLLLVRTVRKAGHAQANVLLKLFALPVAAALLVLFACMPQSTYTSLKMVDSVLGRFQTPFSDPGKDILQIPVGQNRERVNLASVGPKSRQQGLVMKVTAQTSGYLYLKGAAYDTYQGTWWESSGLAPEQPAVSGQYLVNILTLNTHDVLYLPYNTEGILVSGSIGRLTEENGRVKNPAPWRSYDISYGTSPQVAESWQLPAENIPGQFTQLPDETRAAAQAYLQQELPELETAGGVWSRALRIVEHVADSGRYSLQTPKMPGDGDDFAMWFLRESDSGYCTHFASAAVVLLRAAQIPCRYVTGYLAQTQADRTVQVRQSSAHAWVECYINGVGWVPMEPTPAEGVSQTLGEEASENTVTTDPFVPEQTDATEQTPVPTQTDEETKAPAQTTEGISGIGGADSSGQQTVAPDASGMLGWLWVIFGAVAAVPLQIYLRVWFRGRRRTRGGRKAQALARWREVVLHCRFHREEPDPRLHELAQKAKFSQHTLSEDELREFDSWLRESRDRIRKLPVWRRCLAAVVYALY